MWTKDKKNISSNTFYLSIVSFLMNFANSIIFSNVAGLWANKWHSDLNSLVQGKAIAEAAGYFFKFILGFLSDMKNNRKTFLLLGYGSVIITKPLFLFSVLTNSLISKYTFSISNILDRIANNFRDTPRDAIIAYSIPEERVKENLVYRKTISYVGSLIGGIFSIIYFHYFRSFTPAFIFSVILSFIGLAILIYKVDDPIVTQKHEKNLFYDLKDIFTLDYILLLIGFVILFAGKFGETAIYPILKLVTNNSLYYRISFIAFYMGSFISSLFVYKIKKNSLDNIISFGVLFSCANFLILYVKDPNILLGFSVLFGIFNGVLESLTIPVLLRFAKSERKGAVIGTTNLVIGIGYSLQSYLIRQFTGNQIYYFSTTCLVLALIILMTSFITFQKKEES